MHSTKIPEEPLKETIADLNEVIKGTSRNAQNAIRQYCFQFRERDVLADFFGRGSSKQWNTEEALVALDRIIHTLKCQPPL